MDFINVMEDDGGALLLLVPLPVLGQVLEMAVMVRTDYFLFLSIMIPPGVKVQGGAVSTINDYKVRTFDTLCTGFNMYDLPPTEDKSIGVLKK